MCGVRSILEIEQLSLSDFASRSDDSIPEFNFSIIKDFVLQLDIEPWEMNRTHWSVKDENLFKVLELARVVDKNLVETTNENDLVFEYPVAFSFAGEDREYVDKVANLLRASGINPFYDKFEEDELWGKNLYDHLADIYENKAQYTVMFISKHYAEKQWTDHERSSAQARAFAEHKEYILPARFDDTKIPGLSSTIGYVKIGADGKSPDELCALIKKKLSKVRGSSPKVDREKIKEFVSDLVKTEFILYLEMRDYDNAINLLSSVNDIAGVISKLEGSGILSVSLGDGKSKLLGAVDKFIEDVENEKLSDYELLALKYMSDIGKNTLGVRWKADEEKKLIERWQNNNIINNCLLDSYDLVISKFKMRGYIEVSEYTSYNNPREYILIDYLSKMLLDFPDKVKNKIDEIMVRNIAF